MYCETYLNKIVQADELYKKALTVDPQNANLLVHRWVNQKK
jgi:hypothetical protein